MKNMDIQVIDIKKITGSANLRAFADVKVDDSLIIKGFSVMNGKNGIFVKMPSRPSKDGKWFNTVEAANDKVKELIDEKVLEAYDREVDTVNA